MTEEILRILNNDEIFELVNFFRNLNNKNYIYVHLYLLNQMKWNLKMEEMSDLERDSISDRCKQKFYCMKSGNKENRTIIGITGEQVRWKIRLNFNFD